MPDSHICEHEGCNSRNVTRCQVYDLPFEHWVVEQNITEANPPLADLLISLGYFGWTHRRRGLKRVGQWFARLLTWPWRPRPDQLEGRTEIAYYCAEHAQEHGYCYICGQFWAGVERFDFDPSGLCPNCQDAIAYELGEDDEDEWGCPEGYYPYPV